MGPQLVFPPPAPSWARWPFKSYLPLSDLPCRSVGGLQLFLLYYLPILPGFLCGGHWKFHIWPATMC